MTFLEIFEKYNLTEKEVHTLQVMKACELTKSWIEAKINFDKWQSMIDDGILVIESYSSLGRRFCKVSDLVHE